MDFSPPPSQSGLSSSSRSVDTTASMDPEPPDVTMDSSFRRVTSDAYTSLCKLMPPTIVERESAAVVNLNSTDRLSRQPSLGFRRVTSSRLSDALSPFISGNLDSSMNLDAEMPIRANDRQGSVGSGGMTPMQASGRLFSLGSGLGSGTLLSDGSLGSSMPMSPGPPTPAPITGSPQLLWSTSRRELEVAIQTEKSNDHATWDEDLLSEERRLNQRLGKLKLEMFVMEGDGNCQFRAVSFELYGSQDYHKSVRRKAVDYMRAHPEDFEPYLDERFDMYLRKMGRNGTWGDELTLRAICDAYGVTVNVITSEQHNWFMRYNPQEKKLLVELFVTYIAPVHYNAVKRRKMLTPVLTRRSSLIAGAIEKAREEEKLIAAIPESPDVRQARQNGQLVSAGGD